MTRYITTVGVQQVSITIASGSLTNTATITAVGSGAFIIYQGANCTDNGGGAADEIARIELTNSTTVTATRGVTGTSQTITVNAVVIDGDTTNLVKSVQSGTIAVAAGSTTNTATISAVTNANTAIVLLGHSYSAPLNDDVYIPAVTLSGTTVTANVFNNPSPATITVGYCVIEFQGSALNSAVQNLYYSSTVNAASDTIAITSVNTSNTMLAWGGAHYSGGISPADGRLYAQLTSSTVVTLNWYTSSSLLRRCALCVIEFASGVLTQLQRGTLSLSSQTSNTGSITNSTPASTLVNYLGNSSSNASGAHGGATTDFAVTQTNATTLTVTANSSTSGTLSYEAIEFATSGAATPAKRRLFSMDF